MNLIGVYWHAIFNDVEKILKSTPTYSFQIAQMDICFYIQMQTKRYYLAVENEDICFTESDGSEGKNIYVYAIGMPSKSLSYLTSLEVMYRVTLSLRDWVTSSVKVQRSNIKNYFTTFLSN